LDARFSYEGGFASATILFRAGDATGRINGTFFGQLFLTHVGQDSEWWRPTKRGICSRGAEMNTHEYNGYSLKWNEETGIVSIFNNDEFIKKTLHYSEKDDGNGGSEENCRLPQATLIVVDTNNRPGVTRPALRACLKRPWLPWICEYPLSRD